jgi:transketolase
VGLDGAVAGLDRFGASAPYAALYRELGLTAEAVVEAVRRVRAARADGSGAPGGGPPPGP